jgi:hypothetical protein
VLNGIGCPLRVTVRLSEVPSRMAGGKSVEITKRL